MKFPAKNLRKIWHQLLNTKRVRIDGVWVSTEKTDVPRSIRSMLFRGTYEAHERQLLKQVLKPDSVVLEIGTGVGLVSLICRKICSKGTVRSYEANPKMETLIRKNYASNSVEPNLVMKAVTLNGGDISFFIDDNIISSSGLNRDSGATETTVHSERLDDILVDLRPDTIILDVEGAETSLLGESNLQGVKNIVVEMHPHIVGEKNVSALIDNMRGKDFELIADKNNVVLLQR